ncbi:dysbindin domain-containing protein 1 [Solea senegalensis]|uniref:Dysbindin domain-containing protein 1 n=1 Tax=Solea senegalensis TaxID=28829 RepID=A0AAV6Q5E9_SOLSE|nr:dysbindin domain-containing protein 1 [Solea senegalensis]
MGNVPSSTDNYCNKNRITNDRFFALPPVFVSMLTEPNKDIQKLLKPSSSGDLNKELFQHPAGEEESCLSGHTASLLHITERRQPLSSVSSLEVHFDLLDLTELTDMSDQELAEVFVDSEEENHNEFPAGKNKY